MKLLRLLVYEHVSGGGYANKEVPMDILSEGFGMLRSLTSDFAAAGHQVITMLDSRIANLNPPVKANCIIPIYAPKEVIPNICAKTDQVDACYIIAPETNGVLASLAKTIEKTRAKSLNCPAEVIEAFSNKWTLHEFLSKKGFIQPQTLRFSTNENLRKIKQTVRSSLSFPVIIKPLRDTSCCGVSIVTDEKHISGAISKIGRESTSNNFLVQELIEGSDASISLLAANNKALAIDLNSQEIKVKTPCTCSRYWGGIVPFNNYLKPQAKKTAEEIVHLLPPFRGYIGIDFVLTKNEAVPIEINLRLTTSYIGLSRVVNINLAQAIIDAVFQSKLPTKIKTAGYSVFSKIDTPKPQIENLKRIYKTEEVFSPPFPISNNDTALALIATKGATQTEAKSKFREAKKRVLHTINRGK